MRSEKARRKAARSRAGRARQAGSAAAAASIARRVSDGAHARHLGEHLAGRRIVHGERRAGVGARPRAVDVAAVAQQLGVVDQQHARMMAGTPLDGR